MLMPRRVFQLVLPAFSALMFLGAPDADASILRELDELIAAVDAGEVDLEDVNMTKRQVQYTVTIPVHGAMERKQVRYARLLLLLDGDRRLVYEDIGWPTARRRTSFAGSITEHWIYEDLHVEYIFKDGELVTRRQL